MSELTPTPEELIEDIEYEVEDASVIPTPIDPTLTHAGEAADAKAVGDAIKAVGSNIKVNTKAADSSGNITVYATDIAMSDAEGAQTVANAIGAAAGKTAQDILYGADDESTDTIADVVDDLSQTIENGVTDAEIDAIFEDWGNE